MGRERVPAHVRRLPAPRRPARRPLRAPPPLPRRDRPLHACVARVRHGAVTGVPDRGARRAGAGRGGRLRGRPLADDDPVHRARGTGEGDGDLRLRRLRRRQPRRTARGNHHRRARLALDLPRQRPRRSPRGRADRPARARRPRRGRGATARRRRRGHGHRVAHARRLRDRERQPGGLDVGANSGSPRRIGRAARGFPRHRVEGRRAACAARPLPAPEHRRLERRRRALGGGHVRLVLPLGSLPAARARLQPARGRPRLPARQPDHGRALGRRLREARHALRVPAAARRRPRAGVASGCCSSPAPRSTEPSSSTCSRA